MVTIIPPQFTPIATPPSRLSLLEEASQALDARTHPSQEHPSQPDWTCATVDSCNYLSNREAGTALAEFTAVDAEGRVVGEVALSADEYRQWVDWINPLTELAWV